MIKLWLRRAHLVMAIVVGAFIICLSLTGALLIYAKDIQYLTQPQLWRVEPQSKPLGVEQIVTSVESTTAEKVSLFMPEQQPDLAWQLKLSSGDYVSVNPYSGKILHRYEYYSTLYGYTMALHRWLLFEDADNKKPLRDWVSICALVLIIELVLGFYLWVKPKNRLKRLVIKPKAKLRILLYQLHTVLGVYLLLPILLIAFSGMAFNWKPQTKAVVEWLSFDEVEARPKPPTIAVNFHGLPYDLNSATTRAKTTFPDSQLFRIYMPDKASDSIAFRVQNPGESHAYSWVWVNPYNSEVVAQYDASKAGVATQVWNFKYKFHIGDFAGPIVQFVWLILALAPTFFTVSGLYFWLQRHRRKR